jgi:hypothetical protein
MSKHGGQAGAVARERQGVGDAAESAASPDQAPRGTVEQVDGRTTAFLVRCRKAPDGDASAVGGQGNRIELAFVALADRGPQDALELARPEIVE